MFHYGKTPSGELEVRVSGPDVAMFYRAVSSTGLLERRDMYQFKTYIEENFKDELATRSTSGRLPKQERDARTNEMS